MKYLLPPFFVLLPLMGFGCVPSQIDNTVAATPAVERPATEDVEFFSVGDYLFSLPEGWTVKDFKRDGRTTINTIAVSHDPWETALEIRFSQMGAVDLTDDIPFWTVNGVSQYKIGCGGPWYCFILVEENDYYDVTMTVQSNEPLPENLDGAWSPDPGVTRQEVDSMFKTIQPAR